MLVLSTVDEIASDCKRQLVSQSLKNHGLQTFLKAADVAARECDADFVDFGRGNSARCVVFFLALSDVTHPDFGAEGKSAVTTQMREISVLESTWP